MHRYVLKRCLWLIPSLLSVTLLCFLLLRAADGDPLLVRGDALRSAQLSSAARAQLHAFYGLDLPWYQQYARIVGRFVTLDLGTTWQDGRPIREVIGEALPVTVGLTSASILLAYLLAVPLGVFAALRQHSLAERALTLVLFLLYSLPSFWLGTLLLVFFASGTIVRCPWLPHDGCFPLQGWHSFAGFEAMSPFEKLRDVVWHACLPVLTLTYPALAVLSRFTRAGMLDSLQQDFIRTARAKGLSERAVVFGHALRHSLLPIVTLLGLELPQLVGGAVIVEAIFGVRGMGLLALEAIRMPDYPLVVTIVALTAALTLLGSLAADLVYAALDPRIDYRKD